MVLNVTHTIMDLISYYYLDIYTLGALSSLLFFFYHTEKCTLTTVEEYIAVTDALGHQCVTSTKVPLSYCNGTCPSLDVSSFTVRNPRVTEFLSDVSDTCKCCVGLGGSSYTVDVDCGRYGTQKVQVMQFSRCRCLDCAGRS